MPINDDGTIPAEEFSAWLAAHIKAGGKVSYRIEGDTGIWQIEGVPVHHPRRMGTITASDPSPVVD